MARTIQTEDDLKQALQDIIHGTEEPYTLSMEYAGQNIDVDITSSPLTAADLSDKQTVLALQELLDEGNLAQHGIHRGSGVELVTASNMINGLADGRVTPETALQNMQHVFEQAASQPTEPKLQNEPQFTQEELGQIYSNIINGAEEPYTLTYEVDGQDVTVDITSDPLTVNDLKNPDVAHLLNELADEAPQVYSRQMGPEPFRDTALCDKRPH